MAPNRNRQVHNPKHNPWISLIPVGLGLFMVLLDVSVLNVALPRIAEDFHARMSDVQWILNAYTLTMVVLLVLAGRIGDMVRRDRYFMAAMALFAFSSFLCAQAWNVGSLIVEGYKPNSQLSISFSKLVPNDNHRNASSQTDKNHPNHKLRHVSK